MNRFLRLLSGYFVLLLMGCQLLVVEPGASSAPAVLVQDPSTHPSLYPTVVLTVSVAPTLIPVSPSILTDTVSITTTIDQPVDSAVTAETGLQLYRQYYCGVCHQLTVAGTKGMFGPSHDGIGQVAGQRLQASTYHGTATTAAAYLQESLVDPQAYIVPGYELTPHRMPSFRFLSPHELTVLVQWLSQQ